MKLQQKYINLSLNLVENKELLQTYMILLSNGHLEGNRLKFNVLSRNGFQY